MFQRRKFKNLQVKKVKKKPQSKKNQLLKLPLRLSQPRNKNLQAKRVKKKLNQPKRPLNPQLLSQLPRERRLLKKAQKKVKKKLNQSRKLSSHQLKRQLYLKRKSNPKVNNKANNKLNQRPKSSQPRRLPKRLNHLNKKKKSKKLFQSESHQLNSRLLLKSKIFQLKTLKMNKENSKLVFKVFPSMLMIQISEPYSNHAEPFLTLTYL